MLAIYPILLSPDDFILVLGKVHVLCLRGLQEAVTYDYTKAQHKCLEFCAGNKASGKTLLCTASYFNLLPELFNGA